MMSIDQQGREKSSYTQGHTDHAHPGTQETLHCS